MNRHAQMRRSAPSFSGKWVLGVPSNRAFTLIELLTVMGIVAVLASFLLPALTRSREQARSSVCINNMRQLSYAVFLYADDHADDLPWAGAADRNRSEDWVFGGQSEISTKDPSSWNAPDFGFHAESGSIFQYATSFEREEIHNDADKRVFKTYRCPSTGALGAALRVNYSMNAFLDPWRKTSKGGVPVNPRSVKLASVLGPSEKILFVNENPWNMLDASFEPVNPYNTATEMFQMHNNSSNFSFFDGSVHRINGEAMVGVVKTMEQMDRHFDPRKF